MTKEELQAMISQLVQAALEDAKTKGQIYDGSTPGAEGIQKEFDLIGTLRSMGMASQSMPGGYLITDKGSVLNPTSKNEVWVKLSPDVEKWAKGFAELVKSRGAVIPKVLEENSDPSGGYLVPEEFRAAIVQYDTEPAVVWPRATIWPMSTDKLGMPKLKQRPDEDDTTNFDHFAGVAFTWTDEGGEKTETEPEFEFLELIAHELSGYTEITDTLLADSAINLMNFLTNLFRRAYVWQTDRSFIRGTGARQPFGVVMDPTVQMVARATAGAFTFTDAINMDNQLSSVFDQGAVWMMNKRCLNSLRNERDTQNSLVFPQWYQAGAPGIGTPAVAMLLGKPVVLSDAKTYNLGTTGDVILGNWAWYYIGDRKIFAMDVSKHYKFRNNKTAIRVVGRLDGQPAIGEAFVILGLPGGGS